MFIIFLFLCLMNGITEYLLNKMMFRLGTLQRKYRVYHIICALLRIIWISLCAWSKIPTTVMLIVLLALLFLNVAPYPSRSWMMNNFNAIIYLIYVSLLMLVIGIGGAIGIGVDYMVEDTLIRAIVLNATFIIFNVICFFLLRFNPESLWKEDRDRFKVTIYTRFLAVCIFYHILDAVILTLYGADRINYILLVSGDILILFLMFNFWKYNFVFSKGEEVKKQYEENQVLIAQQYFEKERLRKMSEYDSLTNTYNRREISSIMLDSIQKKRKLVCAFIDLDGLKRTNDKYGHTYGDLILKRFADACTAVLPDDGYLARIGGDEFLLVCLDKEADYIEKSMKELQAKLLEPEDEKEKIHFSYGISYDEASVDKYIALADQRMYADKNKKRCDKI